MAKSSFQKFDEKVHKNAWTTFSFVLILLILAYGGVSWAIDNGSLLIYAITIVVIYWAFKETKRGILALLHKK